ncbi:protein kinase [bacterium]|nr:protein kinase [bacterium]
MLEPGKILQGRYKIEKLLGSGGMSTVYLAEHLRLGRKLAVKALKPNTQSRVNASQLEAEARIMAGLSHPALALVTDFFDEGSGPHLVMEFVQGRNLEEIAQMAPRPLSQRRVLEFASQLLDVLEYLHGHEPPVIVRDLKPTNVMLDGQRLRLIDFGLAKFFKRDQKVPDPGMGSLGYAPIEQFGRGIADERSDLYALGATLLFLLTDQPPPDAATRLKDKAPLLDPRTLNDTVSDTMWTALQCLLEIEPSKRPANVEAARAMLFPAPIPVPVPPQSRKCPACGIPLQKLEQQKVEVDLCPNCCGMWLDKGELEQLVEVSQVYAAPVQPKKGKKTLWQQLLSLMKK